MGPDPLTPGDGDLEESLSAWPQREATPAMPEEPEMKPPPSPQHNVPDGGDRGWGQA